MKNYATLTLVLIFLLGISNSSFAGSMKKFNMRINVGTYVEVLSKVEEAVNEKLPTISNAVRNYYLENHQLQQVPVIEELPVDEDLVLVPISKLMISDYQLANIVSEISIPETTVEETFPFALPIAK